MVQKQKMASHESTVSEENVTAEFTRNLKLVHSMCL